MRFIYTKTFTKIFVVFVFIALLIILDATGYLSLVKSGFFRFYGMFTNRVTQVSNVGKNIFSTLFVIKNLAKENSILSQKVDDLSFANARLESAQQENSGLRKALNFEQQSKLNLLSAEVLDIDPTGLSQTIVISRGEKSGLHLNQPVVAAPGLLVGKVTKLYSDSAQVTLITDPNLLVNAEVADSGARGIIRGEHGLALSFDLVTQNDVIKSGDEVITSGLSDDFPRGLLIGEVSAIRSSQSELFQKAFVSPAADLRSLRFLFVVR